MNEPQSVPQSVATTVEVEGERPKAVSVVPRSGEIVARMNLAPHPAVAREAIRLLDNPRAPARELSRLLANDVALTSRVMQLANSCSFGTPRQAGSIELSLMRLGLQHLRGIFTESCIRSTAREISAIEQMVWENSVVTALACRETAVFLRKTQLAEELYVIGLLHDIGKFALMDQVPELYEQVLELCREGNSFVEAEKRILTYAHQLVGSLIGTRWNLPAQHCQIILMHHQTITTAPRGPVEAKRAVVQFADQLAHHLGYGHEDGYPQSTKELNQIARFLGFKRAGIDAIIKRVELEIRQLPVFSSR